MYVVAMDGAVGTWCAGGEWGWWGRIFLCFWRHTVVFVFLLMHRKVMRAAVPGATQASLGTVTLSAAAKAEGALVHVFERVRIDDRRAERGGGGALVDVFGQLLWLFGACEGLVAA